MMHVRHSRIPRYIGKLASEKNKFYRSFKISEFDLGRRSSGLRVIRLAHTHQVEDRDTGNEVTLDKPKPKLKVDSDDWQIIKTMGKYIWPDGDKNAKIRVVSALSLLLGGKLLNVQVPILFKDLVDNLNIADIPPETSVMTAAGTLLLGYGGARLGASLFSEFRNVVFANVAQQAIRRVACNIFTHLHSLDLSWHLSRQTGGLSRAIDRGTKGISFLLSSMVFHIAPTTLEIMLVSGILSKNYGTSFAFMTVGTMAAYTGITFGITAWRTKFRKQMNAADNAAATRVIDSLVNYEAVKYFNNESYELKRYDEQLKKYEQASIKTASSLALLNTSQNAVFSLSLTAMMWLASESLIQGSLTVGDLVMINGLVFQLSMPLNFLGTVYRELKQSLIDMNSLFSLESIHPKITDKKGAIPFVMNETNPKSQDFLRFENVSFSYLDERPILKNISFEVAKGSKLAIVGPSGCGKSTVLKLLFRFFDPSEGKILVNGKDVREYQLNSLRKHMGVVPQDTVLFNDTIYYNIAYGRPDATREEVEQAAKSAQLHDLILSLPEKYETQVGERGLKLSGGEKQRVAIARLLLKKSPIRLFDEPTSSLDIATEGKIVDQLNKLESGLKEDGTPLSATEKPTSVVIAHRLSTVMDADKIIVLGAKDMTVNGKFGDFTGKVIESGTHHELLSSNGIYASLWRSQQHSGYSTAS